MENICNFPPTIIVWAKKLSQNLLVAFMIMYISVEIYFLSNSFEITISRN